MQQGKDEHTQASRLRLVGSFLRIAHEEKSIKPGGILEGTPVSLTQIEFPTVEQCSILGIGEVEAKRLAGQQRFEEVSFREVDFSGSKLDFSVWSKCSFRQVIFDRTSLQGCAFFGCEFFNCSFKDTNCSNASFSVEGDGAESVLQSCCFQNVRFIGASWCTPTFIDCAFVDCRFSKSEFDGAMFKSTRFAGRYEELNFRGQPRAKDRNRLDIDLSNAEVTWVHANHGIDLSGLRLSPNGSNLVIRKRQDAIPLIVSRLTKEVPEAKRSGYLLENIYTDKSISPLSTCQETVFVSAKMLAEFDETLSVDQSLRVLHKIRDIALELGFVG